MIIQNTGTCFDLFSLFSYMYANYRLTLHSFEKISKKDLFHQKNPIDEFEDKNRPCILVYIFWLNAKIIEKIQYPQTYNVFLNPKTLIATYEKK